MTSFFASDDKRLHGVVSFACVMALTHIPHVGILAAVVLTMLVGIGKEAFDYMSKTGTPDALDVAADAIGIAVAVLFLFLVGV